MNITEQDHRVVKNAAINAWINDLPHHQLFFVDPSVPPVITVDMYRDWLTMAEHYAARFLIQLDRFEDWYRLTGFEYHVIPWATRHNHTATEIGLRKTLRSIFESDKPRKEQPVFKNWFKIYYLSRRSIRMVKDASSHTDVTTLRDLYHRLDRYLEFIGKITLHTKELLTCLEANVDRLAGVRPPTYMTQGEVDLKMKWTQEGSGARRWVNTFPEMAQSPASSRTSMIEGLVWDWVTGAVGGSVLWSGGKVAEERTWTGEEE